MVFQFQLKIFSFEFERKGLFSGSENVFSSFQSGCAQRDVEFLLPDPEKAWVGRRGYHATGSKGQQAFHSLSVQNVRSGFAPGSAVTTSCFQNSDSCLCLQISPRAEEEHSHSQPLNAAVDGDRFCCSVPQASKHS